MAIDYSILSNFKTVGDYNSARRDQDIARQVQMAQIKKSSQLDVDALGEQAFMKAAMGQPLAPQELAAAQYVDAKSGGQSFNPVTGEIVYKPRISDKIGLGGAPSAQLMQQATAPTAGKNFTAAMRAPEQSVGGTDYLTEITGSVATQQPKNEWDMEYQRLLADAPNPKARQEIMTAYAKSKLDINAEETKAAGFADRIATSNPLIEQYTGAGINNRDVRLDRNLPDFISNRFVSKDYQSFNQAQRDFINAQLRRESGAAIAPSEFDNAAKQYFPQVGDSEQVLEQKKNARELAYRSMKRSAGPAYRESPAPVTKISGPDQQASLFAARKAIKANPAARGAIIQRLRDNGIPTEGL